MKLLPPRGPSRALTFQSLVYSTGAGTFMAGSPVFFTRVVGLEPVQIGVGISLAAIVSLVGSVPMGLLLDRVGAKRAWLAGALAEAALFATYPLAHGMAPFLVVVALLALVQSAGGIAIQVYSIEALPEEQRVAGLAYQRSAMNVGFTVGGGIAAVAMAIDTVAAYCGMVWVNAAILVMAAIFITRMPAVRPAGQRMERTRRFAVVRDPSALAISALTGSLHANATILLLILPLWTINYTDAPLPLVALLMVTNTILAVLFQVRASRGAETAPGSARLLWRGALWTAMACLIFACTKLTGHAVTIAVLFVGTVILTLGELQHSSGTWGITVALSPPGRRAEYVGTMRLGNQLQRVWSPAGLTALILVGGGWGWLIAAAGFVFVGSLVTPAVLWSLRRVQAGSGIQAREQKEVQA